jgi:hypothetical protein
VTRHRGLLAAAVVAGLALTFGLIAVNWTPAIPADAGSVVLTRATLTGSVAPDADPDSDGDSEDGPSSPNGGACLDRVTHPGGWMDLCWEAFRVLDLDPLKDYYSLRVYGTVSGEPGGTRWSVVRAGLVGQVADGAFDAWPEGTFEGPCRELAVDLLSDTSGSTHATICGRTVGQPTGRPWSHSVTWTCVGCLVPDRSEREIVLYQSVGVPQGTVPGWDIGAEFGS